MIRLPGLFPVCLIACSSLCVQAQDSAVTTSTADNIKLVAQTLQQLNEVAGECLAVLTENNSAQTISGDECDAFLSAVRGDPDKSTNQESLSYLSYKKSCNSLLEWRELLAVETVTAEKPQDNLSTSSIESDRSALLDQLLQVEYYCGNNALQNTSPNLISAYNLIDSTHRNNSSSYTVLNNQLRNLEYKLVQSREQQRLRQALNNQNHQQQQTLRTLNEQRRRELLQQQLLLPPPL